MTKSVQRVAERAGVDPDRASDDIRAVFAILAEDVPPKELDDIKTQQLPRTFDRFFASKR